MNAVVQPLQHFFLLYGEVIYADLQDGEKIKAVNLNGVLVSDHPYLTSSKLAEAQATLQQALHARVDAKTINVKDALIKSINPMGQMTLDTFAGADVLAEAQKAANEAALATQP